VPPAPVLPEPPQLLVPSVVRRPGTAVYPAGSRFGPRLLADHELVLVVTGQRRAAARRAPGDAAAGQLGARAAGACGTPTAGTRPAQPPPLRPLRARPTAGHLRAGRGSGTGPSRPGWRRSSGTWCGSARPGRTRPAGARGAVARCSWPPAGDLRQRSRAELGRPRRGGPPVARALAHVRRRWERDGLVPLSADELAALPASRSRTCPGCSGRSTRWGPRARSSGCGCAGRASC
jgi:hypothetical protein